MMKGNEAIAEAAVRAGVRFYAGYPITPSSEIMEYLSWRLPEVGGAFVQAESELAGINMVIGAAASGVRALTASSGPGISLKQEGISTLNDEELSAVVIAHAADAGKRNSGVHFGKADARIRHAAGHRAFN